MEARKPGSGKYFNIPWNSNPPEGIWGEALPRTLMWGFCPGTDTVIAAGGWAHVKTHYGWAYHLLSSFLLHSDQGTFHKIILFLFKKWWFTCSCSQYGLIIQPQLAQLFPFFNLFYLRRSKKTMVLVWTLLLLTQMKCKSIGSECFNFWEDPNPPLLSALWYLD